MNKTKVELTDTGIFVQILNPLTGRMEWKSQPEDYDYQQELARAAFAGQLGSYLWGILGQWDFLLLNLTSIGFTDFFRCLIFGLSFLQMLILLQSKMRHLKKICETDAGPIDFHWFHKFVLDVSSLSFSFLQMLMLE